MSTSIYEENRITGLRVREERKRLKLTQEQAAQECCIGRSQWVRYEKGEQGFSRKSLALFKTLGADADYILTGKHNQQRQENPHTAIPEIQKLLDEIKQHLSWASDETAKSGTNPESHPYMRGYYQATLSGISKLITKFEEEFHEHI